MRLLTFTARRFAWRVHAASGARAALPPGPAEASGAGASAEGDVRETVVAFVHLERRDEGPARSRALRHAAKHLKWLAGRRRLRTLVLHSFTHLGGDTADAEFARAFLEELAARMRAAGHAVQATPFGTTCAWDLEVHGESLAKVWKEA